MFQLVSIFSQKLRLQNKNTGCFIFCQSFLDPFKNSTVAAAYLTPWEYLATQFIVNTGKENQMLTGELACSAKLTREQQRKTLNVTKQKLTVKESSATGEEVSP